MNAGLAVAQVLAAQHHQHDAPMHWPQVTSTQVVFQLYDRAARSVQVIGSWDGWQVPGLMATEIEPGIWQAHLRRLTAGTYAYKFLLDGERWLTDPANPLLISDHFGGWNSVLRYS